MSILIIYVNNFFFQYNLAINLHAGEGFQLATVAIGLSISTTDWSPVEGADVVAGNSCD